MRAVENMTRAEALDVLVSCGSHAFLWPEAGALIAKAFGLDVAPERLRNRPGEFKGLDVPGVEAGAVVEGHSAWILAERIAKHLDPKFRTLYEGRGYRFEQAIETIRGCV